MSTTLIIVILVLVCVLTTPLSLKRLIDRKKPMGASGASAGSTDTFGTPGTPGASGASVGSAGFGEHPAGAPGAPAGTSNTSSTSGAPDTSDPSGTSGTSGTSGATGAGFDLQSYLTKAVERIIKDAIKAAGDDPAEARFLASFAVAAGKAAARRRRMEEAGEHIPPFLIASITDRCNLHCAGCYARARETGGACGSETGQQSGGMNIADWDKIFTEAEDLGISFIFLVGGEPMLCREIIETAGKHRSILFPIITNGILMDDSYLQLYDRCRNLLPVISIEGGRASTDARRSAGVYDILQKQMQRLASLCIPFGVSITVTTENLREVTSAGFAEDLRAMGCKLLLYIEYVATGGAVADGTAAGAEAHTGEAGAETRLEPAGAEANTEAAGSDAHLEPAEADRALMELRLDAIRKANEDMVVLAFPGDEKAYGGCLAAGRGFFHISACGDAEPCPFAPYSDINLRQTSIREALQSGLFTGLDARGMLGENHDGGCALAHRGVEIRALQEELSSGSSEQ